MKPVAMTLSAALCSGLIAFTPTAEAKPGGCLKYGAAGAVAGHYAGRHAVKGAVLGCIAGIARRRAYNKEQERLKAQQIQQRQQPQQQIAAPPQDQPKPTGNGY